MYPGIQMDMSWMLVASVIWTALAAVGVAAIVWLAVKIGRVDDGGSRVLDELFARGLIEKDDYVRRRELARGR